MLSLRLGRRRDDPRRRAVEALKERLRAALDLADDDELSVSEIVCGDPGCPGTETVALVMRRGERTIALKLPAPPDAVSDEDIACLWLPPRRE